MTPRSLAHRAPLLGLVVAWAAGSSLSHSGLLGPAASPAFLAILSVLGLVLAWLTSLRRPATAPWHLAACLALALAAAGALRTGQERARLADWDALALPPREARLDLRIERTFASAAEGRVGGLARVTGAAPHLRDLVGQRIQFFTTWPSAAPSPAGGPQPGAPAADPLRGARFSALGLLRPLPRHPAPGGFEGFLASEGVNFTFDRARLAGAPLAAGPWSRFCAAAADRLERILRAGLADNPSQADLYVAMLLGQKEELSPGQKDWFIRSGTMHLFAISGLHIAGIALALQGLLTIARLPGRIRFVLGSAILWTYVDITGGSPSAVRAFWMVFFLHGAHQLRAPANSLAALSASALAVLVITPHQLFSASFQMSYGIVAALLLYGVPLQEKWLAAWTPWAHLPHDERTGWRAWLESAGRFCIGLVALGLAATLVSTPATLAFFGLLTPGGFFINLLLIPASTLVLFAGVASLLAGGLGLAPLAYHFNHAAALLLAAMEKTVGLSLAVPGVSLPASFTSPGLASFASVAVLAVLAWGYALGWPRRLGGYFLPYAALAALLALGVRLTTA